MRRGFFAAVLAASKSRPLSRGELLRMEREAQLRLLEGRGRVDNVAARKKP